MRKNQEQAELKCPDKSLFGAYTTGELGRRPEAFNPVPKEVDFTSSAWPPEPAPSSADKCHKGSPFNRSNRKVLVQSTAITTASGGLC
jgi:hypothetical protein